MYFAGADKPTFGIWERMAGTGTAGAVMAPVAGAGVAIATALAIPGEIAVLGAAPLLVGVAVGTVVTFGVGYAVGDRGYLMLGGPVLHILVGGAAVAGVVGGRLTGLTVAGVGGVGLLLFVARLQTGNLRRHAALPANPSRVQATKAAAADRLLALRSGIRRVGGHLLGRMALGAAWSVTTTGLLWLSAAIAAGGVSVPPSLPPKTLSMVPAAGYLVALFAPFFVWTDWLGLEGIDPEMRAQFQDSSDGADSTTGASTDQTPAQDPDEPAVDDPATTTDEPSELPEAPPEADAPDGASRDEPPAEATGADAPDDRDERSDDEPTPSPAETGTDDVRAASDGNFLDADPEELWTPEFGEDPSDAPDEEIEIPGLEEDPGDELWGGMGRADEADDEPLETGTGTEPGPAGTPADADDRAEAESGETPTELEPGDGMPPETGAGEDSPAPGPDAPDSVPADGEDDTENVTPGERVRSYEPRTDPADDDGSDDAIPIYGPGDDEDVNSADRQEEPTAGSRDSGADGETKESEPGPTETTASEPEPAGTTESEPEPAETAGPETDPELAGTADTAEEGSDEASPETTGETERLESDDVAASGAETPDERADEREATEREPAAGHEEGIAVDDGVTEPEDATRTDADPDAVADATPDDGEVDASQGETEADADFEEVEADTTPDEADPDADPDEPEADPDEPEGDLGGREGSTVPEPTRPPVDTDAVEAADEEENTSPSVSRGRPVGVREVDAEGRARSDDRTRARRGKAPRSVERSDTSVPRDGSPAPDRSPQGTPGSDDGTEPAGTEADVAGVDETRPDQENRPNERVEMALDLDDSPAGGDEPGGRHGAPSSSDTRASPPDEDPATGNGDTDDEDVSDITDAIEEDLDRLLGEDGREGDDVDGAPGDQSGVSDSVSAILSGEKDHEDRSIDRSTAEEIADILSGDDEDDETDSE